MKISIALSLLILVIGSVLGWQDHQRHATVRASRDQVVAEAAKMSIDPGPVHSADGSRVTKRGRQREDKEADAKTTAAEFIRFIHEMEALEKKGGPPDEATRARAEQFKDRMKALDPAQVKILIAEARANKDLTDESRENLIAFSIMTLADSHPQAALALLTESPDSLKANEMVKQAMSTALAKLAQDDPAAALAWVRANSAKFPDLVNDDTKRGMISGTAVNDPMLAFKLIAELGLKDGYEAIYKITNAPKNPEERTATLTALRAYLTTLPEGEMRDKASKNALRFLGQNAVREGFEAGSKWLASTGPDLEYLVESSGLFSRNYREESGQWIEWVGVNLSVEKSKYGISKMVRNWTKTDYQAAGKWLTATPASPTKDTSIRSYAETVAQYEPETAAQWAMTLPPGEDRQETLKNIYQSWPANEEAAKQAFKKLHGIK
jgi:hypothetical protein